MLYPPLASDSFWETEIIVTNSATMNDPTRPQ